MFSSVSFYALNLMMASSELDFLECLAEERYLPVAC